MKIKIQRQPFDIAREIDAVRSEYVGAISSFLGTVRHVSTTEDSLQKSLKSLTLEHYPLMVDKYLRKIAIFAKSEFKLDKVVIIHRFGELFVKDDIVLIICSSAHRKASLGAVEYIIDNLKTDAAFWKLETFSDSSTEWVCPPPTKTD